MRKITKVHARNPIGGRVPPPPPPSTVDLRPEAGPLSPPASVEDRMYALRRGVERVLDLRGRLGSLAHRVQNFHAEPTPGTNGTPTPSDLNGKLGEVCETLHTALNDLENIASHFEASLFTSNEVAAVQTPARGR